MKLSQYIADFVADLGVRHAFGVVGGGAMILNDAFGYHDRLTFVPMHHEQAASFAAEASARLTGFGCCLVTTGPGSTNAITGVSCAWVDSTPMIFISGQVPSHQMIGNSGVRQMGVQESDIVAMVKPITKFAATLRNAEDIRHVLEMAVAIAKAGRPGPVWIDIPLELQGAEIDPAKLWPWKGFYSQTVRDRLPESIEQTVAMLRAAKRPVMIVGNGVRLAGAHEEIRTLIGELAIPVISSWSAADMVSDLPYHIGHCGLFGDRAGNFTVQNADLLLVVGCRLSVPQMGYNADAFAREAQIIMVDIDPKEMSKYSLKVKLPVCSDAKAFIEALSTAIGQLTAMPDGYGWVANKDGFVVNHVIPWLGCCTNWRERYPVVLPEYEHQEAYVNSFWFAQALSEKLPDDATVVLATGTAFTCLYQAAKMKRGQRWIAAAGFEPMGWALPAAIGAAFATGKRITCIVGDGDLQFNLQELATIEHHKLPITIYVINNDGYLTIAHMQNTHFKREVGCGPHSGVSCGRARHIANAYGIHSYCVNNNHELLNWLNFGSLGEWPCVIEIMMDSKQLLTPRIASHKAPDGSIRSSPLEDMSPLLPREEFKSCMIVPTMEE